MALLDSNYMAGSPPPGYDQGMGMGMQVPQLPPSLAQQLMQRAQMRRNPQTNPLMAATAMSVPPMDMMPPFQPTELPKPKEFWESQFAPNPSMVQSSMQDALPKDSGIGLPGQLPQAGGLQIPNNTAGMGLGATAPQMMGGMPPQTLAPGFQPPQIPGGAPKPEDDAKQFGLGMFDIYKSLYGG
jgi:hypothetical protein